MGNTTILNFELVTKREIPSGGSVKITDSIVSADKNNFLLSDAGMGVYYCFSDQKGGYYINNYTGKSIVTNAHLYGQAVIIRQQEILED